MTLKASQEDGKKGGGLGSFLRRTLGGALAVVGLGAAPLRRETLELIRPAETMEQLVSRGLGAMQESAS